MLLISNLKFCKLNFFFLFLLFDTFKTNKIRDVKEHKLLYFCFQILNNPNVSKTLEFKKFQINFKQIPKNTFINYLILCNFQIPYEIVHEVWFKLYILNFKILFEDYSIFGFEFSPSISSNLSSCKILLWRSFFKIF